MKTLTITCLLMVFLCAVPSNEEGIQTTVQNMPRQDERQRETFLHSSWHEWQLHNSPNRQHLEGRSDGRRGTDPADPFGRNAADCQESGLSRQPDSKRAGMSLAPLLLCSGYAVISNEVNQ